MMKKNCKTLSTLLAMIMVVGLVGCTGSTQKPSTTAAESNQPASSTEEQTTSAEDTQTETAQSDSGDKVQLELWDWWGDGIYRETIEKLCDDFNQSQDKSQITHVHYPWGDVWTKALAATAAGNPPDVIIQDINNVAFRAKANQAVNLQPYIDKEDDMQSKFYPALWNAMLYEDQAYGIPFVTDTRILYYDKDDFAEAGLDPEKAPATWDEFLDYARKLDKKDGDKYVRLGYHLRAGVGLDIYALNADGLDFVSADGQVTINADKKVKAMEWFKENFIDYYGNSVLDSFSAEFAGGTQNAFVSGKVSMYVNTPTDHVNIELYAPDKNYGMAFLPTWPDSKPYSTGGGFSVEIPYNAKDIDASWEFVKFLTGKDAQLYWGMKVYDTIANIEASQDPSLQALPPYKMAIDNMEYTLLTPQKLFAPDYMNSILNPILDEIERGSISVKDGFDTAQKQVEELISQNR